MKLKVKYTQIVSYLKDFSMVSNCLAFKIFDTLRFPLCH